jgi:putative acetyltransferase
MAIEFRELNVLRIVPAETEAQYRQIRELLAEYIACDMAQLRELGIDTQEALSFYFASGEEELPGVYAPPEGRLFLATYSGHPAGCGALRRISPDTCELKRMYVRPQFRQKQIGRGLANKLILAASQARYSVIRLETTTFMNKALAMYSALGFRACEPYCEILESFRKITVFMELPLVASTP